MNRRRRGERRVPRGRLRLRERDARLLAWVGRAGVASLADVAIVFWPRSASGRVAASRRLRTLLDHGLIEVTAPVLHAPNRVTLTGRGAELALRALPEGAVLRTRIRAASAQADHLLATAATWAAIATAAAMSGIRLHRFVTEAEIRRAIGRQPGALIPDAIVALGVEGRGPLVLALEVDLDHEPLPVFARKLVRYVPHLTVRAALAGLELDALLVVAPAPARLRRLAGLVARAGLGPRSLFQTVPCRPPDAFLRTIAAVDAAGVVTNGSNRSFEGFLRAVSAAGT